MDLKIVNDLITYDPEEGTFKRKSTGKLIGTVTAQGYLCFHLLGKARLAHRVVFFLENGGFPKEQVDHIDGNRQNNKRSNLRIVTSQQNKFNRKPNKTSQTNIKNVYWIERIKSYRVKMKVNGLTKHYGYFKTIEAASSKASEVQKAIHKEYAPSA